ncbi:threonine synthase [Herbaspirillum huttiense]|uniref:Threonine synthase n=1 Tax=Herbaspirillum huttiense subsp. lycopersici TaxID=3074428 RepID=A0ABU2ELC0_9BURK|nr:threonine synthase [Herbaspirillum huttiense]MDR9848949.1 threonine synthase [Herbaspirillum huttiense SE1]
MNYISTRGDRTQRGFSEVLLEGLAPDGGLYVPLAYPRIDDATLQAWRTLSYPDLAFEIMALYVGDMPAGQLRSAIARTYTAEIFATADIVPLRPLEDGLFVLGLSNGPTFAFKDVAMQLLGNLLDDELGRRGEQLNIVGATSGDTGSAAEYAMRGKKNIQVFMLSPHGRMSPFQQAQMFSLQDRNIHNMAVEGSFDTCQDIVKAISSDLGFKRRFHIGTVNSINWARLLAQVVYYFAGYFQATRSNGERVSFAVPSGNFGNICAGHVARMMGLPIDKLVLATNENDVLDEFFRTGCYRPRSSAETPATSSPSMDIAKASNLERFIFDVLGRDAQSVQQLFGEELAHHGKFVLSKQEHERMADYGFVSGKSTHADRLATISQVWSGRSMMIDPHTADGVKVARDHRVQGVPTIVLETALPLKFEETMRAATGRGVPRPAALADLEARPRRFAVMQASTEDIKERIATSCGLRSS